MAKVGVQRATELTGRSKSTIQRAMKSGKLSFGKNDAGRSLIDVSELERVFGVNESLTETAVETELQKAKEILEAERVKMRVRVLEDKLHNAEEQIVDLKAQRDQWQKQAQQVLITSQFSQKQAEDYKEEIKEREARAREARERRFKAQQGTLLTKGSNQNGSQGSLWDKLTGKTVKTGA